MKDHIKRPDMKATYAHKIRKDHTRPLKDNTRSNKFGSMTARKGDIKP